MYLVPMNVPECCNKCPFGHLNYNHPYWSCGSDSKIDGKRNASGTYGYVCKLDSKEHGRYTKVLRANLDKDISRPKWCKLKEAKENANTTS